MEKFAEAQRERALIGELQQKCHQVDTDVRRWAGQLNAKFGGSSVQFIVNPKDPGHMIGGITVKEMSRPHNQFSLYMDRSGNLRYELSILGYTSGLRGFERELSEEATVNLMLNLAE